MDSFNENYWLESLEPAPGCDFYLLHTGCMRTLNDRVYRFGNFTSWHVVISGRGYVRSLGKTFHLKAGDMFSIMEDSFIEYGAEEGEHLELYFLRIEGKSAGKMTRSIGITPKTPVIPGKGEELIRLFAAVWQKAKEHCQIPEEYGAGILQIVAFLRESCPAGRRNESILVSEALNVIVNRNNWGYNVSDLAAALQVSRTTLFHTFKRTMKITPSELIAKTRLDLCQTLIRSNMDSSFAEIARMAHFKDEKYFLRFFRRLAGMTPGEYRKTLIKTSGKISS